MNDFSDAPLTEAEKDDLVASVGGPAAARRIIATPGTITLGTREPVGSDEYDDGPSLHGCDEDTPRRFR